MRWAAVGDSLARVLQASGAAVSREYYFNDHGAQIDRFSRSLLARALGEPAPEDGYGGDYITEIAEQVVADALAAGEPDPRTLPTDEANEAFRARGVDLMFAEIKQSLHDFGVDFDVYFHEDSLHESGAVDARGRAPARARPHLRGRRRDVAAHHRRSATTRTASIIRSNGEAAYIAGDIAYYLDKRERGFDRVVIMLGADHHGYIGRMMADLRRVRGRPRASTWRSSSGRWSTWSRTAPRSG